MDRQKEQLESESNTGNLDSRLNERGLLLPQEQAPVQKYTKDFVSELRRARNVQKRYLYGEKEEQLTFSSIQQKLIDISLGNKEIEDQVKMEVLGIQNSPLKKLSYHLTQFYKTSVKGMPQKRAEDIISEQLNAVKEVIAGLTVASVSIDGKSSNLENYYDKVLINLMAKYQDRDKTLNEIEETTKLLAETENAAKNAEDFSKRLMYSRAHRKLRKDLQNKMLKIKITDKAMLLFKNELPLLDNLGEICESYSNALKETSQEAIFMARHIENVMQLYLDMMRSQKIDMSLDEEVKKLFTYTNNMNKALSEGAASIVEKANKSALFTEEYKTNALTLDTVLGDIESSNSRTFRELENRISAYLEG